MLLITMTEFARRVDARLNAVRYAAYNQEALTITKYKGKDLLDWNSQEDVWYSTRSHANKMEKPSKEVAKIPAQSKDTDEEDDNDEEDIKEGLKLGEAKAKQAVYEARLKRLAWEEKQGTLVPSELVEKEWNKLARRVKKSVLAVPARLAAMLAAERDPFKVKLLLDTELKQALLNMDKAENDDDSDLEGDTEEAQEEEALE
jgi:phage terminase Nu1 subunit (DNA packaging protein)